MLELDAIDLFYLRMPEVRDIGDGSQDALLVRARAGDLEGWGECEAAPLPCLAAWCAPMSHAACHPVEDVVRGVRLDTPSDIVALNRRVRAECLDVLQAAHLLSGIDTALWDLLARHHDVSVPELLGASTLHPKQPYASVLFGDDPAATEAAARRCRQAGFTAAKFGWGPIGRGSVAADTAHLEAARAGMGPDAEVLVDVGTVWYDDVERAAACLPALESIGAGWLEEPFVTGALAAYRALAARANTVPLAAGEGAHQAEQAEHLVEYGGIGFVQVDAGRIGGISTARQVAQFVRDRQVRFVNHTFTSNLALVASLAPYWDDPTSTLCEYPTEPSSLARELTLDPVVPDTDGLLHPPDRPGLGVRPDPATIARYALDVEITVAGRPLYRSPALP